MGTAGATLDVLLVLTRSRAKELPADASLSSRFAASSPAPTPYLIVRFAATLPPPFPAPLLSRLFYGLRIPTRPAWLLDRHRYGGKNQLLSIIIRLETRRDNGSWAPEVAKRGPCDGAPIPGHASWLVTGVNLHL
ncbi:hypothetical protein BDK51DRAFT_48440 [Blyttiomyces helicus]|uniref:Uncharacterized protein n=1 Tax=Blyttiomyces helicus TaxID=388810 RepID=A0A4P9W851_9FUNG|nr:hypothetical protein BDK51DRAFT_48440 [Blyttiomyces helicus]|eukprot:RKO87613.1 hypothetical protein BDK51DRAFT_48440 [Blyttiomyces helicus]